MKKRPQPDPNSVKGLKSQGTLEKYHELPTELIMWWFKVYTIQFYNSKGKCGVDIFGQFLKHTSGISDFYIFLLFGCDTLPWLIHSSIRGALWCLGGHLFGLCLGSRGQCAIGGSGSGNVTQMKETTASRVGGWCPHVHFMSWGDWGTNWMPTQHLNCR